jgi:surface protein
VLATDTPDLTKVQSLAHMFEGATNLTGNFSGWDTSTIQYINYMFVHATNFDQDLSSWNVSNVRDANGMFTNTKLSTYHYNNLLDKRSRQTLR